MPDYLDSHARELFAGALARPVCERDAFLDQTCSSDPSLREQVVDLLRAHAEAERRLVDSHDQIGEQPGDRVGPYRLEERIGEGGFGTVWRAEQLAPVQRKVALKVLKAGMDTRQVVGRFEAERQALARMDHPNIATIFDGGATPHGRPYFVMELVDGVPITRYCDDVALSLRARIDLFVPICQAVHHAHQKGVIHRDLKPSNVLVTVKEGAPIPKIIDFGIAKATTTEGASRTALTEFRQMLGTPEYMAPEQADLVAPDVDTRADVYSLGVVLYELLTGCRPFEIERLAASDYVAVVKAIQEHDPPTPSQRVSALGPAPGTVAGRRRNAPDRLARLLRGEIDWIVMKALEKERSRRYDTASALADDLLRHLRHEVVLARPVSRSYRLRKFVRRHRIPFAAGVAVVTATAFGTAAAGLGYVEANQQAQRAHEEATTAKHVVTLLERMLRTSDPRRTRDPGYTVRQLLDAFASDLPSELQAEPVVEASLRQIMGRSYLGLGLADAAAPHLERAAAFTRNRFGAASFEAALVDVEIARAKLMQARYDDALAGFLEIAERLGGDDRSSELLRAAALGQAADALRQRGRTGDLAEAEELAARALEIQRRVEPADSLELHATLSYMSIILGEQRRYAEACVMAEELLERDVRRYGADSLEAAETKCSFAMFIDSPGVDLDRIETLLREAHEVQRRRLGDHLDTWLSANNLGLALRQKGDLSGAVEMFTAARDGARRLVGDHPHLFRSQLNLAGTLLSMRRFEEAKAAQEEAIAIARRIFPGDHGDLANAITLLADVHRAMGDRPVAIERYLEAIAMYRRLGPEPSLRYATALIAAASSLNEERRHAEGEALAREALRTLDSFPEVDPQYRVQALHRIGLALHEQARFVEAEAPLKEALERARSLPGDPLVSKALTASILVSLGDRHAAVRDLDAAEACFRESLEIWRALDRMKHADAHLALEGLADVRTARNDDAGAIELLREALELRRKGPGPPEAIAYTLDKLAARLYATGQLPEATTLRREALALLEREFGPNHSRLASPLNNLAETVSRAGDFEEAAALLRRNLEIRKRNGQEKSLPAATSLTNLGRVLADLGELTEAETTLRQALALFEAIGATDHPNFATCLNHLASVLAERGEIAESLPLQKRVVELRTKQLGADDVEVASCLATYASLLLEEGRCAEAEAAARDCLAIRTAKLAGSWRYHSAQALLGRALAGQSKFVDAEPLLVEACTKMAGPPAARAQLLRALEELIRLCESQGREEPAERWRGAIADLEATAGASESRDR